MTKTLIMLTTLAIATTMGNLNNINNTSLTKQYDNKFNNNLINQINFTFSDQSNDNNYFKTTSTFSILKNWNNYANSWEEFIKLYPTFNFDQNSLTSVNMSTNWDDNDYNSSTGNSRLTNTNNIKTNDNNAVIIPNSNWNDLVKNSYYHYYLYMTW